MESAEAITIADVLLTLLTGMISWLIFSVYKLNREVGVMSEKLNNIVTQAKQEADSTERRLDKKKNK